MFSARCQVAGCIGAAQGARSFKRFPQLQEDASGDSTMSGVGEKPSISYDLPVVEKVPGNKQALLALYLVDFGEKRLGLHLRVARNLLYHR